MSSEPIPARQVRIKTFLEMWRDGVLAFVASGGDPDVNTDAALSTFVYVDDGSDVPDHIPHYNLLKTHSTLRTTPAQAAGVPERLWEIDDIVALLS